jgi:hypothetical protein
MISWKRLVASGLKENCLNDFVKNVKNSRNKQTILLCCVMLTAAAIVSCLRIGTGRGDGSSGSSSSSRAPSIDRNSIELTRDATRHSLSVKFSADRATSCMITLRPDDRSTPDVAHACGTGSQSIMESVAELRHDVYYRVRIETWNAGQKNDHPSVLLLVESQDKHGADLSDWDSKDPVVQLTSMTRVRMDLPRLVADIQYSTSGDGNITLDGVLTGRGTPVTGQDRRSLMRFAPGSGAGGAGTLHWSVKESGSDLAFDSAAPPALISLEATPSPAFGWATRMEWPSEFATLNGARQIALKWRTAGDTAGAVMQVLVTDGSGKVRLQTTMPVGANQGSLDMGSLIDSNDEEWMVSADLVRRQTEVFPGTAVFPWTIETHDARVARYRR